MNIPKSVKCVLEKLENNGYEAYIVGGSLRNLILSKVPYDWDITTSALPGEILTVFSDFKTIATGIRHGTVTVISEGLPIEITTFRIDGAYSDSRRPDSVEFTGNLKLDLERRDFTVNAMAYSENTGIIDCFSGVEDCKNKIIRCVGNPEKRFGEDALRILRAFRFVSELGFEIEKSTLLATKTCAKGLEKISKERIYAELCRTVCGPYASEAMSLMQTNEIFLHILPENCSFSEKGIALLNSLPSKFTLRFSALVRQLNEDLIGTILDSLKMKNSDKAEIELLSFVFSEDFSPKYSSAVRFLRKYKELSLDAVALAGAFGIEVENFTRILSKTLSSSPVLSPRDLSLNGRELSETFEVSGEIIGQVLNCLMDFTAENPSANRKELLLRVASEYLKEKGENKLWR